MLMAEHKTPYVMISSTALDLPEHREQLIDACLRQSVLPRMMEHLAAQSSNAIKASLAMVDEADIYLGIFAFRYGYVPEGYTISITQMEYERAVERGIPRLIFLMGDRHPVIPADVETGPGAEKLETLKQRLGTDQIVNEFSSPHELRALAINSLTDVKQRLEAEAAERAAREGKPSPNLLVTTLHRVSDIPPLPEPYIAHPYTLLLTHDLIGRKDELDILTDWVTQPEQLSHAGVLSVVAIGGMGKSALTWKWFNDIAPQEMTGLAGRMWWSFYESDATFENFVTRALAYVSGQSIEQVKQEPLPIQEQQLLAILDQQPFVIVLDGLERILIAYAKMNAAYMQDTDIDDETAHHVAGALGLPSSAGQSFVGRHQLRKTIDVRVGQFLRKLLRLRASRILISTRLYPADLQTPMGAPIPGCFALFLSGLRDQDAIDLWRTYGARGSRQVMLPVFRSFDSHPLLIQVLASEVANFHDDPGNFDAWRAANPDFNPFDLPLVMVQSQVLDVALRGLSPAERQTLHLIAGFRMPASMEQLKALLLRADDDEEEDRAHKPFTTLGELDVTLTALEDRGLLGWDKPANRYDLHPIVRGVTWNGLDQANQSDIYNTLRVHFEAMPTIDAKDVNSLEDLTPAIELYYTLIGLGQYDDACWVWVDRLSDAMRYRLSANRQSLELLEPLFPDGIDRLPRLTRYRDQSYTLACLGIAYHTSGRPASAVSVYRLGNQIDEREGDQTNLSVGLRNLSAALRYSGGIREAETSARSALLIAREQDNEFGEGVSLDLLGLALAVRGATEDAEVALRRVLRICIARNHPQGEGLINAQLAQRSLWMGDPATARPLADRAWELASSRHAEADFIRAARLQGTAALYIGGSGDLTTAHECLHHALTRARACNLVEEELPALTALAELYYRRGELEQARELLKDVWEAAERGPYPQFHTDAYNILAQLESDVGHVDAAIEAATRAFELAWCDGPPFAYHWGLLTAREHLRALHAPEPDLPPFDESMFAPLPEVEINPPDKFGTDT